MANERITDLKIEGDPREQSFTYMQGGIDHSACWPLFLIRIAWDRGCNLEEEADGFGKGNGTMGGDWSGIRDSSDEAIVKMTERALNFLGLNNR